MLKIEEELRDIDRELKLIKEQVLNQITISIAYKPKAKKIRLVNRNNGNRDAPIQRLNQYKQLFVKDTP